MSEPMWERERELRNEEHIIKCKAKLYETSELLSNEFCINYTHPEEYVCGERKTKSRGQENLRSDFNVIKIFYFSYCAMPERLFDHFFVKLQRRKNKSGAIWIFSRSNDDFFLKKCY